MESKKAGRPKTNNVVEMDQTYTLCQEGGFINPSDLEQIMKDLGDENHLNLYIDETIEEYVDIPPEFVDIDEMCDSTQGDEDTIMKIKTEYMSPTCTFPCTENYPGPYNFELVLDSSTSNRKSWVYSDSLHKVFIDMHKVLLVQFRFNPNVQGLRVRALPVYTMIDFMSLPVERCTLHSVNLDPQCLAHSDVGKCFCADYQWVGHVLQSDQRGAQYEFDADSRRHSVVVPMDAPAVGSDSIVVSYQFTCKTSCLNGMQRRPIDLIFTLETPQGEVLGRQRLAVKICSCPKRDMQREECDAMILKSSNITSTSTRTKRKFVAEERKLINKTKKFKSEKLETIPETTYELANKLKETHDQLKVIMEQLKNISEQLRMSDCCLNGSFH